MDKPILLPPDPGKRADLASRGGPPASAGMEGYGPNYYTTGHTDGVEKGSLLDYWSILSRKKGTLIALGIAGAFAGVMITLVQSPVYRAHATIEIQDVNQEFLNIKQASPVEDSSSSDASTDLQTQLQILRSETLIVQTLNKLNIRTLAALNPRTSGFEVWHRQDTVPTRNELIEGTARNLKITVENQTRIIEISFQSTDPKIAATFANTLASEFIDQNMEARWQASQRTSVWLGQQLADLRNNVQRSDDALQAYARQNALVYTGDKENVATEKLRQLQAQVSQAQGDLAVSESRFKVANTASPETLSEVLNDTSLRTLQNKITDLRTQAANLSTTFKPEYSKLKEINAEIETLESALEHERGQVVTRITNDYLEAERREGILDDAYNNQVKLVMQDSQKAIQYDILKREVDTNRQIYENMLQRVKESGIASALKATNIRVIDPATTPDKPFKPSLPLNSVAGLMGGLMFGVAIVITRHRADRRLRQPGDAGRLLGLPELGVIPRSASPKRIAGTQTTGVSAGGTQGSSVMRNRGIVAWESVPTGLADSFRAVLASIIFSEGEARRGVLVITSAGPSEGKTTTSTNLAVALSKIGQKVLLIDGDIRKPRAHEVFGLDNSVGLTNLLNQLLLETAAADTAIQQTDFPGLHVLTSGPALKTGCDLLFTASMPRLLEHYESHFDMIIIDTPPLLHMPDARVLGRMADAVVLVARAGYTLREAAMAARERLVQDRTVVLGVILNDWNPKSSPDGYYGNYKDAVLKRYDLSR
jgi:polysaccharide biosynthesis transport protein